MSEEPPKPKESVDDDLFGVVVLATGMVALGGAFMLGLGAIIGVAGVIMGIVALARRNRPRMMAAIGTGLSAASIGVSAGVVYGFYRYLDATGLIEAFNDASYYEYEDLAYWEGVVAPPLSGETLDGEPFELADHRETKVVLYGIGRLYEEDQPPQRDKIRELAGTPPGDFKIFGFYAGSPADFDQDYGHVAWNFPVVLVESPRRPYSEVPYGGEIVMVVDRNGVFQRVFMDETSVGELAEAAEGPDFSGKAAVLPPPVETGLALSDAPWKSTMVWRIPMEDACQILAGPWDDPAVHEAFVLEHCQTLVRIDALGERSDLLTLPEGAGSLSIGRFEGRPRLLALQPGSTSIQAFDETGVLAWSTTQMSEIDSAIWLDLDADGNDEVVFIDGGDGLDALDEHGKALWSNTDIDYAWTVSGARTADGAATIAISDSMGVGLYDGRGKRTAYLEDPFGWVSEVHVGLTENGLHVQIAAVGDAEVDVYDARLKPLWKAEGLDPYGTYHLCAADLDGDGTTEWAVPLQRGEIAVIAHDGRELCRVRHDDWVNGMALVPAGGGPGRMLVQLSTELVAYEFAPQAAIGENAAEP